MESPSTPRQNPEFPIPGTPKLGVEFGEYSR